MTATLVGDIAILATDVFEPWSYGFFRRGVIVAIAAGALCGLIGVYVVVRNMSYIGHGLSHAMFGGAAVAAVGGFSFYVGAGLWGLASALVISWVARRRIIGADAAIGIVTTASFALGLVLQAQFGQARRSIEAVLFGNVLGVFTTDVVLVLTVLMACAIAVGVAYRQLLFSTFDPEVAQVSGINVSRIEALLMVMLSATILVTVRVVGVLLISALLVLPAACARLITDSFRQMIWISPVLGATFGGVGMYVSWFANAPSGAVIVLTGTALFAVLHLSAGLRRPGLGRRVHGTR